MTPLDADPVNPMEEFNNHLEQLTPSVYVTWILLAINVLVFFFMVRSGISVTAPGTADLIRWGADYGPQALGGEWWRLLTATFVHIGVIHILLNMYCLVSTGPMVERIAGNAGFAILYLVAGMGGSVASLFWNPMVVSAGASGAIFGIYGALMALMMRQHGAIPAEALAKVRNSGMAFIGYNLFFGMTQANVDNAAHIGGLVTGFLCGLVMSQPLTHEAPDRRWLQNLMTIGIGLVLIGNGVAYVRSRYADLPAAQEAMEQAIAVDVEVVALMKDIVQKANQQGITEDEVANMLARDVLPEMRELSERLVYLQRLPASRLQVVTAVANYIRLRKEALEILEQGMRESNEQKVAQSVERMKLAEEAAKGISAGMGQ